MEEEDLVVAGTGIGDVVIWDLATYTQLNQLKGHRKSILRISINPDETLIASISWDGTVRLWGGVAE